MFQTTSRPIKLYIIAYFMCRKQYKLRVFHFCEKVGTSLLCDVIVTLILQGKIGNIVFWKGHTLFYMKMYRNHF